MVPFYEKEETDLRVFHTSAITFPSHLHSQVELLYLTDGVLEVDVNRSFFRLEKGDFIAIFPNSVHSYRTPEQERGGILFTIATTQMAGESAGALQKYHPENPVIRRPQLHKDIRYAMQGLQQERMSVSPEEIRAPRTPVFSAFLQLILARALPQFVLVKNTDSNYFDLAYRVVEYVSQNFCLPLSLESIAKDLGVSKYHLSRIFSEKLHTSFTDYLGSIRVSHAQSLLRSTDDPVTKIAFDCGFESQRTFNRIFHEQLGISPSQYRNGA